MKYSFECVDKALEIIDHVLGNKYGFSRPTRLEMAAVKCFLYPERFKTTKEQVAISVARAALRELKENGSLEYGEEDCFGDMV